MKFDIIYLCFVLLLPSPRKLYINEDGGKKNKEPFTSRFPTKKI